MSSKKIYLIRHGETEYNRKGIVQGCGVDASLNDTGRAQAAAFFEAYKHIPFDKVYTSALRRSIESVQGFIDNNIPWESHAGLNEISWGDKDGVIATKLTNKTYYDIINSWKEGETENSIGGGESPVDVARRQQPVVDLITRREEEKTILICMHGRAMRILLSTLLNKGLHNMDVFEHQNLCLYILRYAGGNFELEAANVTTHLS